jgi:hypothetical protein
MEFEEAARPPAFYRRFREASRAIRMTQAGGTTSSTTLARAKNLNRRREDIGGRRSVLRRRTRAPGELRAGDGAYKDI